VIVVDEFRVLAEELPDLLSGLVRVAVVGRSLGVHLVLATQRPAGVVTAEIRANVNLRIALRVRDRMDSEDVVEAPDAALLSPDRPGRGVFRIAGGPLVEFQAALATGRAPTAAEPVEVRPVRRDPFLATAWRSKPCPRADGAATGEPPPARPPDDLDALVTACVRAAHRYGAEQARAPWLPPLPPIVLPSDVPRLLAGAGAGAGHEGADGDGDGLTLGIVDLPAQQARAQLRWATAADGHLAIVGAPGSGRTGVLRAIVGAASRSPRPVHVHVVDAAGGLADLATLPRVGTVVPAADVVRAGRLLSLLAERGRRRGSGRGSVQEEPPAFLLVDGWEQLLDTWLPVEHGRLVDELVRLARDATTAGVRIAITGGRSLLSGQLPGVLTDRLLLRAADPGDLLLAGVPSGSLPAAMPPGRVLRIGQGGLVTEAQVVLDDLGDIRAGRPPTSQDTDDGPAPLRLLPVPVHVDVEALLATTGAGPGGVAAFVDAGLLPIGLGGEDAALVGLTAAGPGWLVAGQPGSGRSTALACATRVLAAAGREVIAVAVPQSPLARSLAADRVLAPWSVRSGTSDLVALLDRHPGATVVVDDLSQVADTPTEDHVLDRIDEAACSPPGHQPPTGSGGPCRWPSGAGPHVLAGCTPAQAAVAFRGLGARLRSTGTALLMAPVGPADGEAFGIRVPVVTGAPPGRALLVAAGGVRTVQVAGPGPGRPDTGRPDPGRAVTGPIGLPECGHG
jgi:DNA segregation ATPase FtsK/SpoIIIE, S-DNA-T family